MKLYSDLGKVAKKLLSDDYVSGTTVKFVTKAEDGVSYTVTGKQSAKSDALSADLQTKVKYCGATISGKIGTDLQPVGELSYKRTDASAKSDITLKGGESVLTGSAEFLLPRGAGILLSADALNKRGVVSAAFTVAPSKYDWFVVLGAHAAIAKKAADAAADAPAFSSKVSYAASLYDGRESEISLQVEPAAAAGVLSYTHKVRSDLSVAARLRYVRASQDVAMTTGLAMQLDGATTVKAKVDSAGLAGLAYIQQVRPNTKLIMSTAFNVAKFDDAKIGLSVTIE